MATATKAVTVVADAISYVIPGQPDLLPPGQTYMTVPAHRGQDIDVRAEDYDRFVMLGAVVDQDTYAARVAKEAPRKGVPGPDQLAMAATPEAKLLLENERETYLAPDIAPDKGEDPDAVGVREHVLKNVNALDGHALDALNPTELRLVGNRYGVVAEAEDTREILIGKIQRQASETFRAHGGQDTGGQATGEGYTGPGGSNPAPKALLEQQESETDGGAKGGQAKGGKSVSRMNVKDLDAAYGSVEGYPADGNRAAKREFAAKQQSSS